MGTKHAICDYALTLPCETNAFDTVKSTLSEWFKHWAFQKEQGDGGYIHWQIQGSLIKKRRLQEILPKLKDAGIVFGHMAPLSAAGRENIYCIKADTRIAGPWTDLDPEPPKKTKQIAKIKSLYQWQDDVVNLLHEWDDRHIDVIYDEPGNSGKSGFCELLEFNGQAFEIPAMRLMEDIMQCVMSYPAQKAYVIDMPRAMKKDKLYDFFSGIECLKNGHVYDKRYKFKKRRMDRPHVLLFTNSIPPVEMMSRDRWRIWTIDLNKGLVKWNGGEDHPAQAAGPLTNAAARPRAPPLVRVGDL